MAETNEDVYNRKPFSLRIKMAHNHFSKCMRINVLEHFSYSVGSFTVSSVHTVNIRLTPDPADMREKLRLAARPHGFKAHCATLRSCGTQTRAVHLSHLH